MASILFTNSVKLSSSSEEMHGIGTNELLNSTATNVTWTATEDAILMFSVYNWSSTYTTMTVNGITIPLQSSGFKGWFFIKKGQTLVKSSNIGTADYWVKAYSVE